MSPFVSVGDATRFVPNRTSQVERVCMTAKSEIGGGVLFCHAHQKPSCRRRSENVKAMK